MKAGGAGSYGLLQFHFHKPSAEHVRGHVFPLVAHLVRKNARRYLAVVAVLLKARQEDAFHAPIWTNLPVAEDGEGAHTGASVDTADLLPA